MKLNKQLVVVLAALAVAFGVYAYAADSASKIAAPAPAAAANGKLFHVVSFRFKADAKAEQIKAVEAAFVQLPTKIQTIRSFHWGTDVSPEKKANGFTHCYVLSFDDEKGRDEYIVHPEHKAFGKVVGPVLDKDGVFVIDFVDAAGRELPLK